VVAVSGGSHASQLPTKQTKYNQPEVVAAACGNDSTVPIRE